MTKTAGAARFGALIGVVAGALTFRPALAQEEGSVPGAIPDPSTYQGSMELQRQSDEQDQQYRQQQQESQGQGSQGYGGGYGGSYGAPQHYGGGGPDCFDRVRNVRALATLSHKVDLGHVNEQRHAPFDLKSVPTPAERPLLKQWALERHYCGVASQSAESPQIRAAEMKWGWPATERLIAQLWAGKLTYGQFNYRRAMNNLAFRRFSASR